MDNTNRKTTPERQSKRKRSFRKRLTRNSNHEVKINNYANRNLRRPQSIQSTDHRQHNKGTEDTSTKEREDYPYLELYAEVSQSYLV